MGNRAVVTFLGPKGNTPPRTAIGIYLHWNGGPESVLAFIEAAKKLEMRTGNDESYFFPRFAQMIGNYFGGTLSLGINQIGRLDPCSHDNGVYYLDNELNIVLRSKSGIRTVEELSKDQKEKYEQIVKDCMELNGFIFNRPNNFDDKEGKERVVELTKDMEPAVRGALLEQFMHAHNLFGVFADFLATRTATEAAPELPVVFALDSTVIPSV